MPTHNKDELRIVASRLNDTERHDANRYKDLLAQITEQVERYSTLFTTFKAYLPIQAETAQRLAKDIHTKRKRLEDLSSAINYVERLQQPVETADEQHYSQLGAFSPILSGGNSLFSPGGYTPNQQTDLNEIPQTPHCLRAIVFGGTGNHAVNGPTNDDKNSVFSLESPPSKPTDVGADSNFSLNLSPLTKDGDPDFTLQLAPHGGLNISSDLN